MNPETLEITFDTMPVQVCATSEKWRADCILRLAIAMDDRSKVWLADDANHLDVPNLKRLNTLLARMRQIEPDMHFLIAFVGPESAVERLFADGEGRAL